MTSRRWSVTTTSVRSGSPSALPSYTQRAPGASGRYGLSIVATKAAGSTSGE